MTIAWVCSPQLSSIRS